MEETIDFEKLQETQLELMSQYVEIWEEWINAGQQGYGSNYDRLQEIKNIIDTLSMGLQMSSMLQQIAQAKSNIVIPGQKPKSNILR